MLPSVLFLWFSQALLPYSWNGLMMAGSSSVSLRLLFSVTVLLFSVTVQGALCTVLHFSSFPLSPLLCDQLVQLHSPAATLLI